MINTALVLGTRGVVTPEIKRLVNVFGVMSILQPCRR